MTKAKGTRWSAEDITAIRALVGLYGTKKIPTHVYDGLAHKLGRSRNALQNAVWVIRHEKPQRTEKPDEAVAAIVRMADQYRSLLAATLETLHDLVDEVARVGIAIDRSVPRKGNGQAAPHVPPELIASLKAAGFEISEMKGGRHVDH